MLIIVLKGDRWKSLQALSTLRIFPENVVPPRGDNNQRVLLQTDVDVDVCTFQLYHAKSQSQSQRLTLGEPYGDPVSTISIACFSGSESSQQRQVIVLAMITIDDVDTNTRKIIDTAPTW